MKRFPIAPPFLLTIVLAGCGPSAPPISTPPPPPPLVSAPPAVGLTRVMGQTAPTLIAFLGAPALDVREGPARKLQFRSVACVLDAYLYPPTDGSGGEPKVTWIDTRTPAGADFDRASCIASLARAEPPKPVRTAPAATRPGRQRR